MPKRTVFLWIHSSRQVHYMFENFQIIWNYTTYRKNSKQKEVEIDSKYSILNCWEFCYGIEKCQFNGYDVLINNLHPMLLLFSKILKIELNKGLQSILE